MNEVALRALKLIREVKASTISTVRDGEPRARIIDIMFQDEDGLIFTTLKSKPFYQELQENKKVAITVYTKDYEQVRLIGDIKEIGEEVLETIYEHNPELKELIPDETLSPFQAYRVYRGKGEIFDLSGREVKVKRERFAFGGETVNQAGLIITDKCISCGKCEKVCPFDAITINKEKEVYEIIPKFCDECGTCYEVCPVKAIELSKGL